MPSFRNLLRPSSSGRFSFLSRRSLTNSRRLHTAPVPNILEEDRSRYVPGGYHPVHIGDVFDNGTYKVLRKLGYGLYSTVWLARNEKTRENVALKILTADTYDGEVDSFEVDILSHIRDKVAQAQAKESQHVLGLLDKFNHNGPNGQHVCLIFKAMGPDTSTLRDAFPRRRLPVSMARKLSKDLVESLAFLHDVCGVIHADIKPQNILIETNGLREMLSHAPEEVFHPQTESLPAPDTFYMESEPVVSAHEDLTAISAKDVSFRLGDFGTSSWKTKHLTEWIQPDKLRAPEVILGVPWDESVDVWNMGLVIWELVTGQLCFDGQATATAEYSSEAHLAQIKAILGPIPESLLKKATYQRPEDLNSRISFPSFPLDGLCQKSGAFKEGQSADMDAFIAFIQSTLAVEPRERPSARKLLQEAAWLKD